MDRKLVIAALALALNIALAMKMITLFNANGIESVNGNISMESLGNSSILHVEGQGLSFMDGYYLLSFSASVLKNESGVFESIGMGNGRVLLKVDGGRFEGEGNFSIPIDDEGNFSATILFSDGTGRLSASGRRYAVSGVVYTSRPGRIEDSIVFIQPGVYPGLEVYRSIVVSNSSAIECGDPKHDAGIVAANSSIHGATVYNCLSGIVGRGIVVARGVVLANNTYGIILESSNASLFFPQFSGNGQDVYSVNSAYSCEGCGSSIPEAEPLLELHDKYANTTPSSIGFSWNGLPLASLMYSIDGYEWYTGNITVDAPDGNYTLRAIGIDEAGRIATSSAALCIDREKPFNLSLSAEGLEGENISLAASAKDSGCGIDFVCADADMDGDCDGSWAWNDNGTYRVGIIARDKAGNAAKSEGTVFVRNAPPSVSISLPPVYECVPFNASIAIEDSAGLNDAPYLVDIDWGDGSVGSSELFGLYATLSHAYASSGNVTISVNVFDKDGGFGSANRIVNVINIAPNISIGLQDYASSELPLTVMVDDCEDSFECVVEYGNVTEERECGKGMNSFSLNISSLPEGFVNISVSVSDGESVAVENATFFHDTTPPSVLSATDNSSMLPFNSTFWINISDVCIGRVEINGAVADGNGTLFVSNISDNVSVFAVDCAGNSNSWEFRYSLDYGPSIEWLRIRNSPYDRDGKVYMKWKAENSERFEIQDNGIPVLNTTLNHAILFLDRGRHNITLVAYSITNLSVGVSKEVVVNPVCWIDGERCVKRPGGSGGGGSSISIPPAASLHPNPVNDSENLSVEQEEGSQGPVCGNGIVEDGEECERDARCFINGMPGKRKCVECRWQGCVVSGNFSENRGNGLENGIVPLESGTGGGGIDYAGQEGRWNVSREPSGISWLSIARPSKKLAECLGIAMRLVVRGSGNIVAIGSASQTMKMISVDAYRSIQERIMATPPLPSILFHALASLLSDIWL